jgi:hypothetical protein
LRKAPPTLKVRTSFNIVAGGATELSGCDFSAEVEMRQAEGEGEMTMRVLLILAAISFSATAFAQTAPSKIGSKPLVQVKPNTPTGCKLVGTVKGTLWAGDCVSSELRGTTPATETQSLPEGASLANRSVRPLLLGRRVQQRHALGWLAQYGTIYLSQYGALAVASEPGRVWAPDLLNFQLPIHHRGALCVCAGECDA